VAIRLEAVKCLRDKLSIAQACQLLDVSRSTLYYQKKSGEDDVWLMNLIRDIWLKYPFYGYRKITRELKVVYQCHINHKCVLRLMQYMQIQALYRKPRTSVKQKNACVYPYLLKDLAITVVNQVWMVDITYLRLGHRFVYLIALIDVYSRFVVGWHIHQTLDTEGCLIALKNALSIACPDIINSDQGCQFTSESWCNTLAAEGIQISMTGQGRCIDNVFIERLWRTIKYEAIYLNEYHNLGELQHDMQRFIYFYNYQRYHQSLNYLRPADIYFKEVNKIAC